MTGEPLKEVVEHQRKQIELLKQQLVKAGDERDAEMELVRRHRNHLGEIRVKLSHVWQFVELKKIKASKELTWLLAESDRDDDWDVE